MPDEIDRLTSHFLADVDSRLAGLVSGLYLHGSLCWGEFFANSDIDFVGILDREPLPADVEKLAAAHAQIRDAFPQRRFEGFYCQAADLARPPSEMRAVPVHFEGAFHPHGSLDANLVTWHELAERGLVIRGNLPPIHTDLDALVAYSRENLGTYWKSMLDRIENAEPAAVGGDDWLIAWATLGVARLHHLLVRRELTSKSGAGRYILETLDSRWAPLATDALAIRETASAASSYEDPEQRGRDLRTFLAWAIDSGTPVR